MVAVVQIVLIKHRILDRMCQKPRLYVRIIFRLNLFGIPLLLRHLLNRLSLVQKHMLVSRFLVKRHSLLEHLYHFLIRDLDDDLFFGVERSSGVLPAGKQQQVLLLFLMRIYLIHY